jgi:cysteine desulfurase/selenocysteine lyase
MNVDKIKKDFPILERKVHDKRLVYLDNAATSQKPRQVVEAMVSYYYNHNANVHRGIHVLGDESTSMYKEARGKVAKFLGAGSEELIFVRNTTEAINLVRFGWAEKELYGDNVIITSEIEHHSNLVPWQEVGKKTGTKVLYTKATENAEIDLEDLEEKLKDHKDAVKLVALTAVSNATGAVLDINRVVELVKKYAREALILIDGAQSVPTIKTDFSILGVDFLAFSGHKMYGPMGIGGLLVKKDLLKKMGPFLVGGGMINEVALEGTSYGELPDRYDAGTPNVAGAIGLAAACEYLEKLGMDRVESHNRELVEYAMERLGELLEVQIVGPVRPHPDPLLKGEGTVYRMGSVAFIYKDVHAHDVAQILDSEGVAVRSGHHCTMPLHTKFNWGATTRASFGVYNDKKDVDTLVEALNKVKKVFGS